MPAAKKSGTLVDQLWKIKLKMDEQKLVIKKEEAKLAKLKERYEAKEEEIFGSFNNEELMGAQGKLGKVTIARSDHAVVKDWDKLYKFILRNKAFELLQKRVSGAAYRERLEAGKKVPGLENFVKVELKLSEVK